MVFWKRYALFICAAVAILFATRAAQAQAQLDVTATPNNFTIAAGTSTTINVVTHSNASTPASATSVDYTLQITPDFAGGSTNITTNTPQTSTRTGSPAPNDWTPVSITITVPPGTAPGNYSGPLTGRYQYSPGNFTNYEFLVINLTVTGTAAAQDFSVTAAPNAFTMQPGGTQDVVFTATGINGYTGNVTINVPPLPNVTISNSPSFTMPVGTSHTVTFAAAQNAPPGTNTANFSAVATINGSPVNHLVPVQVTIAAPAPDFTLTATPPAVTLSPNASNRVTVALTPLNGFNSSVTVNAMSSRNDVTVSPTSFTLSTAQPSTDVTIAAAANAQSGSAGVTFTSGTHTTNVVVDVLSPVAQPDFTFAVTGMPSPLSPGQSGTFTFTVTPINGFDGTVSVAAPTLPNLTFSPNPLSMTPGTKSMTVTAGPNAQPGTLPMTFTATHGTLVHSAPSALTVLPRAGNAPTITSVTPPAITRGAAPMTLRLTGTNFSAGERVVFDSPSIIVLSTSILSSTLADVTVQARADAATNRPYSLRLTNPDSVNSVHVFVYDQDAIGAPLGVRTAAIVSPIEGTLVAGTDALYPRGLIATTGSGILHGQWRLDGVAYETFDVSAQAGMPVEVNGRVKIPLAAWGEHVLSLAVSPRLEELAADHDGEAAITIISTIETATRLTLFAPADRAIIGREIPTFRWSLVPGAGGYLIEFGTRANPALRVISTSESEWTPLPDQLRALKKIGSVLLWRVRAVFPGNVKSEPTAQRAIVILPEAVSLKGSASNGVARWSGGSDGILYQIDVVGGGARFFSAIAFREQYSVPRFARANATALLVTPITPMGDRLGATITVPLAAFAAADAPAVSVNDIGVTPADGASVDSTQPHVSATWSGDVDPSQVALMVDDNDVTPVSNVNATSIAYESLIPLAPGMHAAKLVIGGTAVKTWAFTVAPAAAPAPNVPAPAAVTPLRTDYTLAPNGTITWVHQDKNNAHVQVSGQGDIGNANASEAKFTGDLAYKGLQNPSSLRQESRNYVMQGNARQGWLSEEAKFGYTTPDFTNGAEFLTSGLARTGVNGKVSIGAGSISYYQPVSTAIHGVLSGNPENLKIHSAAFSTPDGRAYQFRAIALSVDDPGQLAVAGSRLRTLGVFGNWNLNQALQLTGEFASGRVRPDCGNLTATDYTNGAVCPDGGRSGIAARVGFAGFAKNTTYGLMLRHVGTNFVNPSNRGLTNGGVADRTSADLNLGRQFGLTNVSLTVRRQEGGRSHNSPSPRANQTGANLSISRMFGAHVSTSLSAMLSQDRGQGVETTGYPATHRSQNGLNASITEMFARGYSLTETLGWQKMLDHINSGANQTSSTANVTFSGTPITNVTLSANLGATHSVAAPVIGTTNQYIAAIQPSIAIPRWFLSIAPRFGYNRSTNDLTDFTSSGAQYAAVVQFSPSWVSSLVSAQASAEWDANDSSAPLSKTHQYTRRYQASINIRWGGLHLGNAATTPSVLPGATNEPPPNPQQPLPAASH